MTKRKKITLSIMLLFIAATLTIGIYFAFSNPVDRIKPLSTDEENAMKLSIVAAFPNTVIERYYGKHNGYYVAFVSFNNSINRLEPYEFKIAGYIFTHESSFSIVCYKDGEVHMPLWLYSNGHLSKRNIREILNIHEYYEGTWQSSISKIISKIKMLFSDTANTNDSELTEKEKQEIEDAHFKIYGTPFIADRYYGKYDGYYIHFIPSLVCATETKIIADCSFFHSSKFTLSAYKDGNFYKLEDIYENGYLSQEQIQKILIVHNEYEKFEKNQRN